MEEANASLIRVHDTPLFKLIEATWIKYDSEISSINIDNDDVLRYVLWCLDGLKDNEGNQVFHKKNMRSSLFKLVRDKNRLTGNNDDLNLVVDAFMAYCLVCLNWAQTEDWVTFMSLYNETFSLIDIKHQKKIETLKNQINEEVFSLDLCKEMKSWIVEYLTNDIFYTKEDAEWYDVEQYIPQDAITGCNVVRNFELTPKEWVDRYHKDIDTIYKENKDALEKHVIKLRDKYTKELSEHKDPKERWRTQFLRKQIYHPEKAWLIGVYSLSKDAIISLFSDDKFSDNIISKAKKEK